MLNNSNDDGEASPKDGNEQSWLRCHWKEVAFFTGLTGMSMLAGFGTTLAAAKKSDPKYFDQGMLPKTSNGGGNAAELFESGTSLAMKALRRATLYSVGGVSLFCFAVWKLSGADTFEEFRLKMGQLLPTVPRSNPPTSKVDFENLSELFQYVIDEDQQKRKVTEDAPNGRRS